MKVPRPKSRPPRPRFVPAGAALLCLLALVACAPGRAVEAVSLLRDLAAPPAPGAALEGVARTVAETGDGRSADLYRPQDEAPEAALVVVPGATEAGRRDARLVAFAGDLARAGFLVMVPDPGGVAPLRVSPGDADTVAEAVRWLTEAAAVPSVGLAGISYAAGPAVLAALRPEVGKRVAFLAIIGGYHDITAAITYLTTGHYRAAPDEEWRRGPVFERARWLFLRANADRAAPEDAALLEEIATRRLARPPEPVEVLVAQLGSEGRSVWALLSNSDPDRVPALIAALPADLRRDIRGLDLASRPLERLDMPVLLIHGRDDPMVPFTESRDLAARLAPEQARLTVVDGLAHVEMDGVGVGDALALVAASYRLLTLRDAAPKPESVSVGD